jgi:hypothetical protein
MRKSLASRIAALAVLYCVIFFFLAMVQFSNKGNFSLSIGEMTLKGNYLLSKDGENMQETGEESKERLLTGGVKLFYGGLEFNIKEERQKGLELKSAGGVKQINPEYMIVTDTSVSFGLPGGTLLFFNTFETSRGPELQIIAELAEDVIEVKVPITPRRSSIYQENGQYAVLYDGLNYFFTAQGQELQNGMLTFTKENTFISYHSRFMQTAFDPQDYIIAQSNNYSAALANWKEASFNHWSQNAAVLQNEDDIIAFCTESLTRGGYNAAVSTVSRFLLNNPRQTFRSSVFIGGMNNAIRSLTTYENERLTLINRLIRERSPLILNEEHVIDFLFTRNHSALALNIIDMVYNMNPDLIISDYCPGLFEIFLDMRRWRSSADNPISHLTDQILFVISENLSRDTTDHVFASNSQGINMEYSLRLGKALNDWAEITHNTDWAAIGKSLVLSALTNTGAGAGNLYNMLNSSEYPIRATWLADNGIWALTVSPNVRASYSEGNMNITVTFPTGMPHFVIIRGITPFLKLQIHDMDWRTDSQFERYDSSGWAYYPQEQILVLKLRHRTATENVRIFYREEPRPVPVIIEPVETETGEEDI